MNDFDDAFSSYKSSWPIAWERDGLGSNIFSKWPNKCDPWLQEAAAQQAFEAWKATFDKLARSHSSQKPIDRKVSGDLEKHLKLYRSEQQKKSQLLKDSAAKTVKEGVQSTNV